MISSSALIRWPKGRKYNGLTGCGEKAKKPTNWTGIFDYGNGGYCNTSLMSKRNGSSVFSRTTDVHLEKGKKMQSHWE
jgi:hypothetical protein